VSRGRLATPHGTVLDGRSGVFAITASAAIEIHDLFLKSTGAAISVQSSGNVVLERLAIDAEGEGVLLEGQIPNLSIRQNEIRGKSGIVGKGVSHRDDLPLPEPPPEPRHESSLTFEDNWIHYQSVGLQLEGVIAAGQTRVIRNKLEGIGKAIDIGNASEVANASTTISENHVEVSGEMAIEIRAKRVVIRENHVAVAGDGGPGILVNGEDCLFAENFVEAKSQLAAVQLKASVAIVTANRIKNPRDAVAIDVSGQATLLGNVTSGRITPPVSPNTPVTRADLNAIHF
jgi:hypothetical protein